MRKGKRIPKETARVLAHVIVDGVRLLREIWDSERKGSVGQEQRNELIQKTNRLIVNGDELVQTAIEMGEEEQERAWQQKRKD